MSSVLPQPPPPANKFKNFLKRHLRNSTAQNEKHLKYTMEELKDLIQNAIELFRNEPMLGQINPPVIIVGDIHGQYYDLLRMFGLFSNHRKNGAYTNKFVFLGDYVDRGRRSLECICLVLALKLSYPDKYLLLRGNHECKAINQVYGFYDELADRFDKQNAEVLWNGFNEVFSWMPLCGLIGKKILCMHGGISSQLNSLEDIKNIPRPLEDPNPHQLAMDLLWADPMDGLTGFAPNSIRGVSVFFGEDAVKDVCTKLNLDLIVRAHQVMMTGFGFFANRKLVTVFTAPRYQSDANNSGAVMFISNKGKVGFKVLSPDERTDCNNAQDASSTGPASSTSDVQQSSAVDKQ